MNSVENPKKERYFLKLLLWFIFLSTLGVGGGIFFLLFAVVPIEQIFTDRGWSQFKLDSVMKYFVIGWVIFGFVLSFLYFFLILKKNYWRLAIAGVVFTISLLFGGLYYFLNTGTGLVQSSQGEIVEGDRFTFGPYPEADELKRLKEEGYDGVISLLSSTLPIEKPLLDKEIKSAEDVGLTIHSLPMLPWVGDNSKSIDKVKELIRQDDKRYYVHCYLGRHRVDVVKTVVNEELGNVVELKFLQPTTLERGSLFYLADEEILMGPFPTDEEWFTRIKRGKTQQILSLLKDDVDNQWVQKVKETTKDVELDLNLMPLSTPATVEDIRKIAVAAKEIDGKVYIHNFIDPVPILMLQSILTWDKTLAGSVALEVSCGSPQWIGRKMMSGCTPSESDRAVLIKMGIEVFINADGLNTNTLYETIQKAVDAQQLVYWITDDPDNQQRVARMAEGLLYGSLTRGEAFKDKVLETGTITKHERNLLVGPILAPEEYKSFAQINGIAQIIYLRSVSTESSASKDEIERMAKQANIPISIIELQEDYADIILPLLEQEQGMTYVMTNASLIPQVNAYLKQY